MWALPVAARAIPGVAHRVLHLVPRGRRGAACAIPAALQIALGLVPLALVVILRRSVAVAVGGLVVRVAAIRDGVGSAGVVLAPVLLIGIGPAFGAPLDLAHAAARAEVDARVARRQAV